MGHARGHHPNSLAALKPAQKGEIRNPKGINGSTRDHEAWRVAVALADAIQAERDPVRRDELLRELGDRWFLGAIGGDTKILTHLIKLIWPLP